MTATQSEPPKSGIEVKILDGMIVARYTGRMDLELVQDAANRIRAFLPPQGKAKLLYDTREMAEPDWDLTRWMRGFSRVIEQHVAKAATVASSLAIKAHATAAFVGSGKHSFFSDYDEAVQWLKS